MNKPKGALARVAGVVVVLGVLGAGAETLWAANDDVPSSGVVPDAAAVTYGPPDAAARAFSSAELRELVARIALFPDDLVALILPASTYPLQVVQAARYLVAVRSDPSLQPDDNWDDSIVALLNYPEIIELMDGDLRWTARLGEAVIAWQSDVIAAVGHFRADAYAAGNLESDERQVVDVDDGVVRVSPADPQSVYVPYYEPELAVVPHYDSVIRYYPRAYPVYYHPYTHPYSHSPLYANFWGVSSLFSIVWHSGHVGIRHHDHFRGHRFDRPHRGHHYRHERHRGAHTFAFGGRSGVHGSGRHSTRRQHPRHGPVVGATGPGNVRGAGGARRQATGIVTQGNTTGAASRRGNGSRAGAGTAGTLRQGPDRNAAASRANVNRGPHSEGRSNRRDQRRGAAAGAVADRTARAGAGRQTLRKPTVANFGSAAQVASQVRGGVRPMLQPGARETRSATGRTNAPARPDGNRAAPIVARADDRRQTIRKPTVARSASERSALAAQVAGQLRAGVRPVLRSGTRGVENAVPRTNARARPNTRRAAVTAPRVDTGRTNARARANTRRAAVPAPRVETGRTNARARPNTRRTVTSASRVDTGRAVHQNPAVARRAPAQNAVAARIAGQLRAGVRPRLDAAPPARARNRAQTRSAGAASNPRNGFGAGAAKSRSRASGQTGARSRSGATPRRSARSNGGFATRRRSR